MTSSNTALRTLTALVTLFSMCSCRPSSFGTDDMDFFFQRAPAKRFYFPVEVSSDAILGALRAHTQALTEPDSSPFEQKRTTANLENLDYLSRSNQDEEVSGMKRKMFWQPLGYVPASVRAHRPQSGAAGSGDRGSSSNVFRYGKK